MLINLTDALSVERDLTSDGGQNLGLGPWAYGLLLENEYAAKCKIYRRPDQQKYTLSRHTEFETHFKPFRNSGKLNFKFSTSQRPDSYP